MTYAYLRDGSVLGRVTGWRGGVPIIDTTDRHPDLSASRSSDLAGSSRPGGEPDGRFTEAPDGEAVPRTRGIGTATSPDRSHEAVAVASSPDPADAPAMRGPGTTQRAAHGG